MDTKKIIMLVVAILFMAAAGWFIFSSTSGPTTIDDPFFCVADGLAEEVTKILGGQGNIVVLYQSGAQLYTDRNERFEKVLKKKGKVTIVARESLSDAQLFAGMEARPEIAEQMSFPVDLYLSLLEKNPSAVAFVSFIGPPAITDEDFPRIPEKRPKFLMYSNRRSALGIGIKPLLQTGFIDVAIVPRMNPSHQKKKPSTPRDWLDQYNEIVTPANAEAYQGVQY